MHSDINKNMRLYELTGYKQRPDYQSLLKNPSFMQFAKQAHANGWIYYGRGANGAVLRHPSKSWGYKIFRDSGREESGYYGYALWASQHQNNPFVPKISKPRLIPGTADLYWVRLEILTRSTGPEDPRFKKYIDPRYDFNSNEWARSSDWGDPEYTLFDHAMFSLKEFDKNFQEVYEFIQYQIDLGPENVMFKGDQLKITDPMA